MDLFILSSFWLLHRMTSFTSNRQWMCRFRKLCKALLCLPVTFNLVTLRPSNKTQVISSGFTDCSFNHLIPIMELTAPSAHSGGGSPLLAAQSPGTISEHLEAPQLTPTTTTTTTTLFSSHLLYRGQTAVRAGSTGVIDWEPQHPDELRSKLTEIMHNSDGGTLPQHRKSHIIFKL